MSNIKKIYSQRCWIDNKLQPATIYFADGKIINIVWHKEDDAEDMGNAVLMPGVIDAHVHVNEPGRTNWEGFDTATMAAAAGGVTTIIDMPLNASPVTTSVQSFQQKLSASKDKLNVNVGFYGGLVPDNIDQLEALMQSGVLGIKCFLTHSGIDDFPNVTQYDLEKAMPLIAKHQQTLLVHCELSEETSVQSTALNESKSYSAYLAGRPKKWENNAIEMMIGLCRKYTCTTHIVHVSSAEALSMIKSAKQEGLPLTAETCAHYLFFNAEEIPDGKTVYKCAPPIREKENNHQLKLALANGVLDFITTDHSPAPPELKEINSGDVQKAWGGIAGLQFLLSSAYTATKDVMAIEKFIPLLTEHPAKFLNIADKKGFIKIGYDADFVIWTPEEEYQIMQSEIQHRHKISPYIGQKLSGKIITTVVNGISVYADKKINNKNAGQWLLRK